ncbi:MAG: PAS domain S-box protein [Chloroflexota bacterium]|nr:PAS domain S-box protein [Chloroflexota bacterium]
MSGKQVRILYMEDDPGLARLFQKKLERAGHIVDLARDGEQGLTMYNAGSYDLVAVDQAMPIRDGLEVIRLLTSKGPLPPTVMITGTGSEQIAVEAMKLGASDYIVKDVEGGYLDLLPTVIERVLQQQRIADERQQALDALRESEERFRKMSASAQDAVMMIDNEGIISFWNPAAEKILGYSSQEALGKELHTLITPERYHEAYRKGFERYKTTGQGPAVGKTLELEAVKKDGTVFPIELSLSAVKLEGKWNAIGIMRDITERKQAEVERERLLAAEHKQRLLAETLAEVTLTLTSRISHETVLDEILRQAQRVVPHSTANIALLKDDALHTVHWRGYQASGWEERIPDMVQPLSDWLLDASVVRSRKPLVVPDTRLEPHWIVLDETAWIKSYISVPICLRDRVLGLLRLDGNIPDQFSAEDAQRLQPLANAAAIAIENSRLVAGLEAEVVARTAEIRAEQEKSETILRNVDDAIIMADPEMRIQYVNEAFSTLTGYTAEEALKYTIFEDMISEPNKQSIRRAITKGKRWQGEVTIQRKDGRTYDAMLTIAPMCDADGKLAGYVSSHRDISLHKDLDRAKSQFIANVSHQLRTPVTTLKTAAYLLRKGGLPEQTEHYLQIMEEEITRLIHLIQDILEMTTLDSGQAVTTWEPISLFYVIENIVTRYQSRAEASGLTLVVKPAPPDLPVVKGDQARLSQALEEIVENAIIFTPAGGQVTVETGTAEDEGSLWVTIIVRDTGPGIPPEEQDKVFDRFFRGSLAESGHVPGTGLGLSIADEILHAHGGQATAESDASGGSIFTLWLRASPAGSTG